jgi:hypothetical protein
MSVTDYARDFPRLTIFPPDHGKLEGATISPSRTGTIPILFMAESVFPDLDGSVIFDGINLQASFHEISAYVGSPREELLEIFLALPVISQATGVVIEFEVVRKHRHQPLDIMRVEGVEGGTVHASNRLE